MNDKKTHNELKNIKKVGLLPLFFDKNKGKVMICLMIPSDPKYGGNEPQIAKGGIEPGENPLQAAIREAWEELGLPPSNIKNIKELVKTQNGKFIWFIAEVNSMSLEPAGYETGAVVWLCISDAFKQIRSWQKPILGYLVAYLKQRKQILKKH